MGIEDRILEGLMVKVTCREGSERSVYRLNLCGEKWNNEEKCWWVPAHKADYIKAIFPHFQVHDVTKTAEELREEWKKREQEEKDKEPEVPLEKLTPEEHIEKLEKQMESARERKRQRDETEIVKCDWPECNWEGTRNQLVGHMSHHKRLKSKEKRMEEVGMPNG